jgi:hypothetical protein
MGRELRSDARYSVENSNLHHRLLGEKIMYSSSGNTKNACRGKNYVTRNCLRAANRSARTWSFGCRRAVEGGGGQRSAFAEEPERTWGKRQGDIHKTLQALTVRLADRGRWLQREGGGVSRMEASAMMRARLACRWSHGGVRQ